MHQVLILSEIADIIVSERDLRGTLVNIALTCRTLYDPAMSALWRYLPDLLPLLRCLPEGLQHVEVSLRKSADVTYRECRLWVGCCTMLSPIHIANVNHRVSLEYQVERSCLASSTTLLESVR